MILVPFYSECMVVDQTRNRLPQVICIKLHVKKFEIFCYHSYDNLILTVEKVKISSFQKNVLFSSIMSDVIMVLNLLN